MKVAEEAEGDWLDALCWRCGSDQALTDHAGRLLCRPCRDEVLETPVDSDPLRLSARAYWESHALERCWRCMREAVAPDDEVGLCRHCRRELGRGQGTPSAGT